MGTTFTLCLAAKQPCFWRNLPPFLHRMAFASGEVRRSRDILRPRHQVAVFDVLLAARRQVRDHPPAPLAQPPAAAASPARSFSSCGSRSRSKNCSAPSKRVVDVLLAAVGQRVPVVGFVVADAVLEVQERPPPAVFRAPAAACCGRPAPAAPARRRHRGTSAECRAAPPSAPAPGRASRIPAPWASASVRNARRLLIRVGLPPEVVIAGHIAVVRGKNDQRLIEQLALLQAFENAADLLIHEAHRAVVALA